MPGDLRWTPALATGVEAIDAQHREIFDAVNALIDAIEEGRGAEAAGELLAFLEGYVTHHFALEELHMRRHAYPGYPGHRKAHVEFSEDLALLGETLREAGAAPLAVREIRLHVCDWLVHHIGQVDRALGSWLLARWAEEGGAAEGEPRP